MQDYLEILFRTFKETDFIHPVCIYFEEAAAE